MNSLDSKIERKDVPEMDTKSLDPDITSNFDRDELDGNSETMCSGKSMDTASTENPQLWSGGEIVLIEMPDKEAPVESKQTNAVEVLDDNGLLNSIEVECESESKWVDSIVSRMASSSGQELSEVEEIETTGHESVEHGAVSSYDLKNHVLSGWVISAQDGENVDLEVKYFGHVVATLVADKPIESDQTNQLENSLGFSIDLFSIISSVQDVMRGFDPGENTLIDFNSFQVVRKSDGIKLNFSDDLYIEKLFFDANVLKVHSESYWVIHPEFDSGYYEAKYGSQYDIELDPICHYLQNGCHQGFKPNAEFNTDVYLYRYSDISISGFNPFHHYIAHGREEGRRFDYSNLLFNEHSEEDIAKLTELFDVNFYWHTNPDQVGNEHALKHYLEHGGKEGRDPSAEFDTAFYLEANSDVRDSGMNALFHYMKFGRNEGRKTVRSRKVFASGANSFASSVMALSSKTSSLTTTVMVMVKNEYDIIEAFTSHILSLFDNILFVDHNSNDGTLEFLEALSTSDSRVSVFHLEEESYIQAVTMNHMVRNLDVVNESDWVFLLDCDEFLPFQTREELDRVLNENASSGIVQMFWKNIIPTQYWDYRADISEMTEFLVPNDPSIYGKIAFKPEVMLKSKNVWIDQGNHTILSQRGGEPLPCVTLPDPLYHVPVRSVNQLALKLNQGVVSYLKIGKKRDDLMGLHWFNMLSNLESKAITPELLNRLVLEYGQNENWTPIASTSLLENGYQQVTLPISFEVLKTSAKPESTIASLILQTGASLATSANDGSNDSLIEKLSIVDKNRLVRAEDDNGFEFPELSTLNSNITSNENSKTDFKFISEFIKPSYWNIDNLTPTAWGGHIQFLFCLVALSKPRRFAELGSHFGASFFAYCQASKRMGISTEPVAIDCWEGDDHTGSYESDVFENFKYVFKKHSDIAKYKRMFFEEAVNLFDDKSVDLLHIDGLHTYEAVKNDYDTWINTLSDTGIILFHDINVHEREFGVWQFWSELKKKHPTMEFKHSHGLGVAYVGTDMSHPVVRLMNIFTSDEHIREFLQHHFETVSQEKITLALNEYALHEKDKSDVKIAELQNELGLMKQELGAVQTLNESYSNLLVRQSN